jgi:hypothetical protein
VAGQAEREAAAEGDSQAATATAPGSVASEPDSAERKAARTRWANLIRHIYEVDPLVCPRCGGMMKIIAFITDARVLRAILDSVRGSGTPSAAGSRHPPTPCSPCRGWRAVRGEGGGVRAEGNTPRHSDVCQSERRETVFLSAALPRSAVLSHRFESPKGDRIPQNPIKVAACSDAAKMKFYPSDP